MNINEFVELEISKAQAYILGLILPLYKSVDYCGKSYIAGAVNHNSNMIIQSELAQHYNEVFKLINSDIGANRILLLANKTEKGSVSKKEGFSVLVEKGGKEDSEIIFMLENLAERIENAPSEVRKEFIKGCFDGRSSWDTTAHYISLDIDRDYKRQDKIAQIIEKEKIEINLNRRGKNHPKNDQIRIKKNSVKSFMNNIGLYSECRTKLILNGINEIGD